MKQFSVEDLKGEHWLLLNDPLNGSTEVLRDSEVKSMNKIGTNKVPYRYFREHYVNCLRSLSPNGEGKKNLGLLA